MKPLATALALIALAAQPLLAAAQDFGFEPPATTDDDALPAALRDLAQRVLPVYQDDDRDRYLANVAALQMVIGDPTAAHATRLSLQERQQSEGAPPSGQAIVYDIYTHARAIEASDNVAFAPAYARAFRERLASIGDLDAYGLEPWFDTPPEPRRQALQRALDRQRSESSISLAQAIELMQAWFAFEAYRSFASEVEPLLAEDNERRYVIEEVAITVAPDATVAAALVRPRSATGVRELPALLEFTLDRSTRDAREAAAHGYASVLALARIAGDPAARPRAPFESDGADARAVIQWIATQSWSDGRVGMQGSRYGGFVAWSAAKDLPAALRAIATSDPMAPGIDIPSVNRIVANSAYRWVYGLLAPPGDAVVNDEARWRALDEDWYRSGRTYREFPTLPGRASRVMQSWLNHPSYDRFWQKWLPFETEFADLGIPALTITGYYSAGETAAMYYFSEHHEHAQSADHALLIGPFDEQGVANGPSASVRELALDDVARVDPNGVRYAWFEHALKGAERPALLRAAVNYQLAGSNEWRHEPSLAALEDTPLRLYLAASPDGAPHALVRQPPAAPMALIESRDLRDRSDADWRPAPQLVLDEVPAREGTLFVTEPFAEPVDLAGRLRGELDFTINQYDVDLAVMLYELTSGGDYVKLFAPAYTFRASYARDRVQRRLLLAGIRQQLPFQSERMIGRRLEAGSRLVLALGINQRADQQINYGAAGDVSEESVESVSAPTRIRWHEGTFIEVAAQSDQ
jgi:putative CocE/NonD family hydrolase